MPDNQLTLKLNGVVSLSDFATAMEEFQGLVEALSEDVAGRGVIDWVIADLDAGSAEATVIGMTPPSFEYVVPRVAAAYDAVAGAIAAGEPIPYSDEVIEHAAALTSLIDERITSIDFSTFRRTISITERFDVEKLSGKVYTLGMVIGTVQTISLRRGLSITIYDPIFDSAIKCSLESKYEDLALQALGKRIMIAGSVCRSRETGRPTSIKNIRSIQVISGVAPGQFESARGAFTSPTDETPEETIRRLRDVG